MDREQRKDNFRDAPTDAQTPHDDDNDLDALGRTVVGELLSEGDVAGRRRLHAVHNVAPHGEVFVVTIGERSQRTK